MDNIDITDPAFSLVSNIEVGGLNFPETSLLPDFSPEKYNSTTLIYIGIAVILFLIGLFSFNYYQNRRKNSVNENIIDCGGGFCTMNQSQI
jgi:hypothetical protein